MLRSERVNVEFVKYEDKYLESCARLIETTWQFHKEFKNMGDKSVIYKFYVLSCLNYSEHLDLIVDDKDEVLGILFGSIENESSSQTKKYKKQEKALKRWAFRELSKGNFGDRKVALQRLKELQANDAAGEQFSHLFESEINLFIVSPELRGKGLGIKLMDRYMEFCKKNNLKSAFLWTDMECSYTFYEKYGFKFFKDFKASYNVGEQCTGMIYYMEVI